MFTPERSRPSLDVIPLICPVCGRDLQRSAGSMQCPEQHSFDIAHHGHVNLAAGRPLTGDNARMVAQRHAFLAAGHFGALSDRVADLAARLLPAAGGLVVDVGGGTGQHLARVLDRAPGAHGLVVDASTAALRRAARAHPRAAAAGWDVWLPWPLASGSVDLLVNIFAPRNPAEFHRVLRPGGALVVVTPTPGHLAELRELVALLAVDEHKEQRLERSLASRFTNAEQEELTFRMQLPPEDVRRAIAMGPSAYHVDDAATPSPPGEVLPVTASFVVTVHRRDQT